MSGGEPPLPPSRAPYQSWHARPPHRRRPPPPNLSNPSSRAPWIPRRSRSPPPPFRARRLPPYKHRHPAQSPPPVSSQPPLSSFHSHSHHPPPLPRNLQPRLLSPSRTPPRRNDHHSFRSDHNGPHRVDHFDPPFRSFDHAPARAPLPKSRTEPPSFRADHRVSSDHHSSYRTELPPHRDEYERRPDSFPSVRTDSQYAPRARPLHGKIHKLRKPRPRRPPSHFIPPSRPSHHSHPSSSDSHIFSRVGERSVFSPASTDRRGRFSPPPPPPPPPPPVPVRPASDDPPRTSKSLSNAPNSRREPSPSSSQSRPLLVQPPPTSGKPAPSLRRSSPPVSSQHSPTPDGALSQTAPMSATQQSAPNGLKPQRKSQSGDELHSQPTCNGNLSPLPNGVMPKSAAASDDGVGPSRELAKRKDKLGLKLGSLGLALTSHALVKQPISTLASLETPAVVKAEGDALLDGAKKGVARAPVSDEVSSHLKLDVGAARVGPRSLAAKPASPRGKTEPLAVKRKKDSGEDGVDDNGRLDAHKVTVLSSVKSENVSRTSGDESNATGSRKRSNLSCAGDNKPSVKNSFVVPSAIPSFSSAGPALSMLRSSPRVRKRPSVNDKLSSIKTLLKDASSISLPRPLTPPSAAATAGSSRELTAQIHEVEAKIISLERELGNVRNKVARARAKARPSPKKKRGEQKVSGGLGSDSKKKYAALAKKILESAEGKTIPKRPKPSPNPMHAAFRLLLTQNRAKAAAAQAECRHLCFDSYVGLEPLSSAPKLALSKVPEEVLRKVAHELKRRRHAALERRRRLAREYCIAKETWVRRLKSARDKRSREKREAIRDRDRFLLLSTKGSSALLTQRTSSGRTSTKIFPSISPNGQTNGMSGLDKQLAEIEAAGGTPGFNAIWSKTLATIPDQDLTTTPIPCTSVLVEDPLADFLASRAVNPWRFEEKLIFLDKFLAYPKNFRKISGFLAHKSSRDCSYFYYTNKLNLGLKQLVKEYQSMKRKGTLRQNVLQVAMKRTTNTVPDDKVITREEADAIISGACASTEDFGANDGSGQMQPWFADLSVLMKRSERILIDHGLIDLEGIDRKAFAHALSIHGHDWKAISMQMRVEGKTSTHYREFFRQNRKALEQEAVALQRSEKLPMSMRRSQGARNNSPRMSPRSSLRSSPKPCSTSSEKLKLVLPSDVSLPNGSILSKTKKGRDAGGLVCGGKDTSFKENDNGKNDRDSKNGRLANAHQN
eukprot:TRINITY_DN886_c0_g1_i1.p1 TRINITY_DN886_c0_g1~~TRINITY_DN886_c0_g1_i1.p1  ORF type:complete len:1234 (+),score=198.84 TRINITY_DN886_c0_g1_i1:228-3929(+)